MADGELLQGGAVLQLHGPNSLLEGYERILDDSSIHLVIIRGLVTATQLDVMARGLKAEDLADIFPAVPEINQHMSEWWEAFGLTDYSFTSTLRPANYIKPDERAAAHIDNIMNEFGGCAVGASLSVAGGPQGASARFYARRPRHSVRADDGTFDLRRWKRMRENESFRLRFSAKVTQLPTDGVIIPAVPWPATHKIRPQGGRWARLFDYYAKPQVGTTKRIIPAAEAA